MKGKFSVIMYLVFIPSLLAIKSMGVRAGEANLPTLTAVRMMTWGTRWCTFLCRKAFGGIFRVAITAVMDIPKIPMTRFTQMKCN